MNKEQIKFTVDDNTDEFLIISWEVPLNEIPDPEPNSDWNPTHFADRT